MLWKLVPFFIVIFLAVQVSGNPLLLPPDHIPLASELSSHVIEHASRLQDSVRDTRLPLPTVQDLEVIRRVAQVLIMLGEQVIPAITGEPVGASSTVSEIPNDPVDNKKLTA